MGTDCWDCDTFCTPPSGTNPQSGHRRLQATCLLAAMVRQPQLRGAHGAIAHPTANGINVSIANRRRLQGPGTASQGEIVQQRKVHLYALTTIHVDEHGQVDDERVGVAPGSGKVIVEVRSSVSLKCSATNLLMEEASRAMIAVKFIHNIITMITTNLSGDTRYYSRNSGSNGIGLRKYRYQADLGSLQLTIML